MIIVTGGAGFIGSNLVRGLNNRGCDEILLVDGLEDVAQVANLADLTISDYMDKDEFRRALCRSSLPNGIDMVYHQGACSDTMVSDGRYVMDNNYSYSRDLLEWCLAHNVPLVYASSAAVYGGGECFNEESGSESPINAYAYSKYLFDNYARKAIAHATSPVIGLRYFNVYGPGEAHKGRMASMAWHLYQQFDKHQKVRLFSGSGGYGDGEQRRDFVTVHDVVSVNLFFYEQSAISGIYNVGTGESRSFNDLALAVINACSELNNQSPVDLSEAHTRGWIEYFEMPRQLDSRYQSFTQADITRLCEHGYTRPFTSLEQGARDYIAHLEGVF